MFLFFKEATLLCNVNDPLSPEYFPEIIDPLIKISCSTEAQAIWLYHLFYNSSLQLHSKFTVTTLCSLKTMAFHSKSFSFLHVLLPLLISISMTTHPIPGPLSPLASSSEIILTLALKPPIFPAQIFSTYLF